MNATWNVLCIKLHSITIGLLKGRHSGALGPKRENDIVLKPRAVPVCYVWTVRKRTIAYHKGLLYDL